MFVLSSRRRHTRYWRDWSSDVCSSDLGAGWTGRRGGSGPKAATAVLKRTSAIAIWVEPMKQTACGYPRWRCSPDIEGRPEPRDRKSVVQGKSVDLGGCRTI